MSHSCTQQLTEFTVSKLHRILQVSMSWRMLKIVWPTYLSPRLLRQTRTLETWQRLHVQKFFDAGFLAFEGGAFCEDLCKMGQDYSGGLKVLLIVADWRSFWAANSPIFASYVLPLSLSMQRCWMLKVWWLWSDSQALFWNLKIDGNM